MGNRFQMVPLGELLTPISRPEPTILEKQYSILGAHWYAQGLYTKNVKLGSEIQADRVYRVEEGDFVYNRLFAWKGSFALALKTDDGCYVSNEFPCFRVKEDIIDGRYLWKYFSRSSAWNEALGLSSGGTPTSRNRLKEEKLLEMEIPLPPLEDQRRIIARIEELAARIEEARGLRREAYATIGALRASAMNALFSSGENVGWPTVTLGEVADIQSGVTLGRMLNGPKITLPYLRVANVQDGYLDLSIMKEVDILVTEFEKWQLKSGDILLTEGGDWDKLGRGAVWRGEIPNFIHQNHIFCVRVNTKDFDPDYLVALISSPYGKSYFRGASKQTTNLATINQRQLKAFRAFKPPLLEQEHIVAYLDDLQSKMLCFLLFSIRRLRGSYEG